MLPLCSDTIKLQTPKGVVEGRDAFIKHVKDGIKKKAKTRPYTAEDLEDPFVKCDIFNAKPPIWDDFVEDPPGTFTRNGKIQKIAFGMQGAMTFKLRHIIEVKGGQLKFIKIMKI